LEGAWAEQDWTEVITIVERLYQVEPDSQSVKSWLSHAYLQRGIVLRSRGFVDEALINFERAMEIIPNQAQAQQEIHLGSAYLAGIQHYQAGRWHKAIIALETVWSGDETYVNVRDLLYSAYYNHSLALQAAGEFSQAKDALKAAITLRPDLAAPRRLMAEIDFAMAPETPPTTPIGAGFVEDNVVVVGIAEQRMVVYEGDQQVFDFVISTGEPGRDTAIGEFEILNKIDVAYASTWNLDMPYWMGIYWAGPLQNGIHSLPIVKHTGYKLWDGYLGQRVSYGCVILSDEDAATLYDWAEIGTKVKIVPSLAHWSPDD
jgi:tetratricopeptide (TPR) repeat protein